MLTAFPASQREWLPHTKQGGGDPAEGWVDSTDSEADLTYQPANPGLKKNRNVSLMIKTLSEVGIEGTYLNVTKAVSDRTWLTHSPRKSRRGFF